MSDWLDSSNNANCFKQTYVQGFVDVSGGSIITRGTGGGLVIGGDSSLNGTVYLGNSIFVQSDGMVAPGTADNGATAIYVDVSGNADNGATSYDVSGNADNGAEVSSVSFPYDASFSQLGGDINGLTSGDTSSLFYMSAACSADAKRIVVGTVSDQSSRKGYARVFDLSNGNWIQVGSDLQLDQYQNNFVYGGYSVAMSADGTVVVVGGPAYHATSNNILGQIKIFIYDPTTNAWTPSKTYNGTSYNSTQYSPPYSRLGTSVAVSRNGDTITVVAGDPQAKSSNSIIGDAYKVQSTDGGVNWSASLSGLTYGYSVGNLVGAINLVAISGDGNVIAVGAYFSNRIITTIVGGGYKIIEASVNNPQPSALSLNGTGNVMLVSTTDSKIIIYRYSDGSWTNTESLTFTAGDVFTGSNSNCINKINSAGDIIAVQTRLNKGDGSTSVGAMRMYQYKTIASQSEFDQYNTANTIYKPTDPLYTKLTLWPLNSTWNSTSKYWVQIGPDLNGSADVYRPHDALAISADGTNVVSGGALASGSAASHVRIYEITNTKTYSDVSGGYYDVSVFDRYNNDGLTSAALYVNGDTDLSGGLTVSGDVSFNAGNLFVAGDLSLNGNLYINSYATNSIGADAIDSTVDIEFANKLSVSTADISFNANNLRVAADLSYNETADPSHNFTDISVNLAANLKVPANIAIVDGSNGTVYGSYLTFTNKDATAYYNVGKSASGIFNIVDQANAGVYLASGGTSFVGTSDARLKTNVAPLESATDKIMALNPCTYQWKSDDPNTKPHVGFIAQEVEQVIPELVHSIDHPAGPDYKGVNTTGMIPYLVRTIQEQNVMIKSLHKEIDILENV